MIFLVTSLIVVGLLFAGWSLRKDVDDIRPLQLHYGQKVRVNGGVFNGHVGKICSQSGNRYLLSFYDVTGDISAPSPEYFHAKDLTLVSDPPQGGSVLAKSDTPYSLDVGWVGDYQPPSMQSVARYYPTDKRWELAPYPQTDKDMPIVMECEVSYEGY